ncbi:STY0301 family protein [Sphingomonas sp.]|uniref:STY0301 family protein n=1 Tax=Sphingomonas sp. TaxID=28214 RepID=UPI003CC5DF3B
MPTRSPSLTDRLAAAAAVALILAAGAAWAAPVQPTAPAATLACPVRLDTSQSAAAVAGWESVRSPRGGRLDSFGFYDGPVAEEAELAPTGSRRAGRLTTASWTFAGHVKPIYFACRYQGTDIVLSRPVVAAARGCTVTTDTMHPAARDAAISCR